MSTPAMITEELREQLAVCEQLLGLVARENQQLRSPDPFPAAEFCRSRQELLPRLDAALSRVKAVRGQWQMAGGRRGGPEVGALVRQIQGVIMRILVLDRENEQLLLRRGMVPPNRLPPPERQRPHFVADLYRRHHAG